MDMDQEAICEVFIGKHIEIWGRVDALGLRPEECIVMSWVDREERADAVDYAFQILVMPRAEIPEDIMAFYRKAHPDIGAAPGELRVLISGNGGFECSMRMLRGSRPHFFSPGGDA